MKKYALIAVGISMNKRVIPIGTVACYKVNPYTILYSLVRYSAIESDRYIYIDDVIVECTMDNKPQLVDRWWEFKNKDEGRLLEFEDDEEALLWYKLNY